MECIGNITTTFRISLLAILGAVFSITVAHYLEALPVCDNPYGMVLKTYDLAKYNGRALSCIIACLQTPGCRSVLVNKETHKCHLNKLKQLLLPPCSSPNAFYITVPSMSSMKMPCINGEECKDSQSECRQNICQCVPGLVSDQSIARCVEDCQHGYGDTFQVLKDHVIWGFTNKTIYGLTQVQCRQACVDETTFMCRHAEYWKPFRECYLSIVTVQMAEQADPGSFRVDEEHNLFLRDCF